MNGEELRRVRKLLRVSVVDAAQMLGVTRTTIYNWEKGDVPIPVSKQALIKRIFEEGAGGIIQEEDTKSLAEAALKKFDALMKIENFKNRVLLEGYRIALNHAEKNRK